MARSVIYPQNFYQIFVDTIWHDVGQADNNQLSCPLDTPQPPNVRLINKLSYLLSDFIVHVVGCGRILLCDESCNFLGVFPRFSPPFKPHAANLFLLLCGQWWL
ncbi:MAG: hypothetical protein FD134_2090 [Gallionellaceae bacterium]|nr:MAG: hypothetical protein FD134_2090 [Gallionellaceae bacterium]